jgi:hypothetical protein
MVLLLRQVGRGRRHSVQAGARTPRRDLTGPALARGGGGGRGCDLRVVGAARLAEALRHTRGLRYLGLR